MDVDQNSIIMASLFSVLGGFIVGFFVKGKWVKKRELEIEHNWRTQDWIWTISFLLYAQVFTVIYKEMVMDVVSYVSTFVSTALGAVAIYISVREVTKKDEINSKMNDTLVALNEKVIQMDVKINKLDPEYIRQRDTQIDSVQEKIKLEVNQALQDLSSQNIAQEDIIAIVNERVEKATEELKYSLNKVDRYRSNSNYDTFNNAYQRYLSREKRSWVKRTRDLISEMPVNTPFSKEEFQSLYKRKYSNASVLELEQAGNYLYLLYTEDVIEKNEDGTYNKSAENK